MKKKKTNAQHKKYEIHAWPESETDMRPLFPQSNPRLVYHPVVPFLFLHAFCVRVTLG